LARRVVGTRQAACDGGGQRRRDYERGVQRENRTDAIGRLLPAARVPPVT